MKQAYAPALEVRDGATITKVRELPLLGKSLFKVGEKVKAGDVVLTAELPGDMSIIRVAERMGFEPEDVLQGMKVDEGDTVEKGQLLCELKTFFGLFTSELHCPEGGVVEFFTELNAHIGIRHASVPLKVNAYIDGTIVEVEEGKSVTIETKGTFVQGIFGVGGERQGELFMLPVTADALVTPEVLSKIETSLTGKIIVGGFTYSTAALEKAAELGVAAVVCGSIDAETLYDYVGYEIGVSITGDEEVPFSLIITEGFGDLAISEKVLNLLKKYEGKQVSVNGATQVRAGATRPEIIVPNDDALDKEGGLEAKFLEIGARIRIIRVPNFGSFGSITELPASRMQVPSGGHVRVLKAKLDNGEEVYVPRANVELV